MNNNINEFLNNDEQKINAPIKKVYDTPYVCNDKSKILFGKFRNNTHDTFLKPENLNYVRWLYSKRTEFKYTATMDYITKNFTVEQLTPKILKKV
jgi:hypothetical protein